MWPFISLKENAAYLYHNLGNRRASGIVTLTFTKCVAMDRSSTIGAISKHEVSHVLG
jgi:hypothetical protein